MFTRMLHLKSSPIHYFGCEFHDNEFPNSVYRL